MSYRDEIDAEAEREGMAIGRSLKNYQRSKRSRHRISEYGERKVVKRFKREKPRQAAKRQQTCVEKFLQLMRGNDETD